MEKIVAWAPSRRQLRALEELARLEGYKVAAATTRLSRVPSLCRQHGATAVMVPPGDWRLDKRIERECEILEARIGRETVTDIDEDMLELLAHAVERAYPWAATIRAGSTSYHLHEAPQGVVVTVRNRKLGTIAIDYFRRPQDGDRLDALTKAALGEIIGDDIDDAEVETAVAELCRRLAGTPAARCRATNPWRRRG